MDWIRTHYDRVTLIAAASFLFISAVSIWWSAVQFGNNLIAHQTAPQPKKATPPGKALEVDHAAEQLQHPAQWKSSGRSGLFFRRNILSAPTVCRQRYKTHR